jgi:hypothetical protein
LKDFEDEKIVKTSDNGNDQCIRNNFVNLQSRLIKKWITDIDSSQSFDFSLEEERSSVS